GAAGEGAADAGAAAPGNTLPSIEQTVHLPPFARRTVSLPVEAARLPFDRDRPTGTLRFAVTAADADDADGLLHELVVRKRQSLETSAEYGTLEAGSVEVPLAIPERIRPDAGEIAAVLSPSVIGRLDGAFRYLRDYPYTGWEQRLTKGVMAARFLRLDDYLDP